MSTNNKASPISQLLQVDRLPKAGVNIRIEADEESRAALASEHGLISVESFVAELAITPWNADGISVKGRVIAEITQECVATLDPLAGKVDEEVSAIFIPETSRLAPVNVEPEIFFDSEADDIPETFRGNSINIGALAEEFFELGIDPFPRTPGVPMIGSEEEAEAKEESPLARELKKLQ